MMTKRSLFRYSMMAALLFVGAALAQYPLLDMMAEKVVQKYQQSSCEQLWQERAEHKGQPKSEREQDLIAVLHNDAQMRAAFINKVAAPVVNKMFECGMVP